ncbi:hypothetical protein [Paraburkholderia silvatlantica]|uniref:Uncharacterized protein n=1 Tax=Paraburkholderia silvatlantica TaxID=321895 RepID=A0A2V4SZ27_9BURK|nr:hypothetical protein [Paraburkholderia silvatlantica]PYE14460.1 hypothetical protein C7410_13965 [Paraburkholderia silvatlantica]TDQ81631.1 hypothetical protein C7412_12556 [Paraburkholderia silvatlantica]
MTAMKPENGAAWPMFFLVWMKEVADSFCYAPRHLQQSINPWTFNGFVINEKNSRNPSAERAIVSEVSYGQQLGRIEDAVDAIIKRAPPEDEAFKEFSKMREKIAGIKRDSRKERFEAVLADLKQMKLDDNRGFQACMESIQALGREG